MADLLLELFSEEIPARMQAEAIAHLGKTLLSQLAMNVDETYSFVTPRRLAVWFKGLPVAQAASETEVKGPKVGAPEAALQGFLKKSGLAQSDLTERDGVYFAVIKKEGRQTADILKTTIEAILSSFPWPKSMRHGSGDTTWVRPLHSILCLFDGNIVPVEFAGIKAGNTTRGHRFLSPGVITITNPADYEPALEKAFVIANREIRKSEILRQAEKAAADAGLTLKKDEGLLEEVTGLVEWPVVLTGSIDDKYMDLPKEVLVSEMRAHQKYFALENKDGSLSDKFLITSNMKSTDGGKAIIAGNERVLRARLSDGRFFWDQDRKKTLDAWAEGLQTVTFHAKLGTIADKVARIETLAVQLATQTGADLALVQRAAHLCKADLTTGMVGEFPELQGVMGRYYANAQKEDASVADAIRDHYLPLGPSTPVPTAAVSICVALADKLDTLVSMFAIGEKPTGSKDPFALRRAALGVIRIILDNNLRLSFNTITRSQAEYLRKIMPLKEGMPNTTEMRQEVVVFFIDRLKVQLKDSGIRHDVISAVVADGDDDLVRIVARAKALQDFLGTEDGKNLLTGYKRAVKLLETEEKKDKIDYTNLYQTHAASTPILTTEETIFTSAFKEIAPKMGDALKAENFTEAMNHAAKMRVPVDTFLENVFINDENPDIRKNRLSMLSQIRIMFYKIANFSAIEG